MINLAHSLSRNYQNLPFTVCIWIQQLTWFQCIPFWIRTLLKSACVWKYHSMISIQIKIHSFYLVNGISVYRYCESREYIHFSYIAVEYLVLLYTYYYIPTFYSIIVSRLINLAYTQLRNWRTSLFFLCDSVWLYVLFVCIFFLNVRNWRSSEN